MPKQANGSIREFKYLPHGKPVPKGWKLANNLSDCHHGEHAVLIEKIYDKKDKA